MLASEPFALIDESCARFAVLHVTSELLGRPMTLIMYTDSRPPYEFAPLWVIKLS